MPAVSNGHEFAALNGLRGVLAVWVMVGHSTDIISRLIGYSGPFLAFLSLAYIAVDAFFILSGFVMAHRYQAGVQDIKSYADFLVRRLARIYPLYFILFTVVFFTIGANPWGHGPYQSDIIRHVLLMQSWWNFSHFIWFNPAWSLSAEWAAYLFFPLLFIIAKRINESNNTSLAIVGIVGAYMALHIFFADNNLRQFIQSALFRVIPCFLTGMLLYSIYRRSGRFAHAALADVALAYLVIVISVLAITSAYQLLWAGFLLIAPLAVIILLLAGEQGGLAAALRTGPAQWLGQVSLSIYLLHYLIMGWAAPLATAAPGLWLAVVYVGTLAGSFATYRLIEQPMRTWLTRR